MIGGNNKIWKAFQKKSGFSLIGVLIALLIMTTSLVAILSLSAAALKGFSTSKNRLIASGLAQEGIEVVRYTRKANVEWDAWFAAISGTMDYRLQWDSAVFLPFADVPLKIDSSGLYQYNTGVNTIFKRKVTLIKDSANEVRVLVEVTWTDRGQDHSLLVEDHLWNWK